MNFLHLGGDFYVVNNADGLLPAMHHWAEHAYNGSNISLDEKPDSPYPVLVAFNRGLQDGQAYTSYLQITDELCLSADPSAFSFGRALVELKAGSKVARRGWNGKGMDVQLVSRSTINGVVFNQHFAIRNVDGSFSTWVPSINDCLARDWYLV